MAQVSGGSFRGEVRDSSDAVITGSMVTIHSVSNGTDIRTETNGDGLYVTQTLVPGSYLLTASKPGFEAEVFGPVTLDVNHAERVNFVLRVGAASDSVEVKATAQQLLSSDSAEISQVIVSEQVSQIPLNGRNWQQLIDLSAGVNPGAPGESGSPNPVNVNGQRTKNNLFLVDGISTTSSMQGRGNNFNIPLDAVLEFSVQAGAYSTEYGDVAGGVINLQSRSGSNDWHGAAFEYLRNDDLDAAAFFSNATGQPKNELRYNQFGASLGGPIRRDKTFFFGDYQGTIEHDGEPMITSVPVGAQRSGDFSQYTSAAGAVIPIFDPFATVRAPFPNNVIPETRQDPAAAAITALLPQPNQFNSAGQPLPFNNYAVTRAATSNVESFDIRIDHQFSLNSNLFARYSFQNSNVDSPPLFGPTLGGTIAGAGLTQAGHQNTGIGHTYQFSPALINEFRIGLDRQSTFLKQDDYGQNLSQQFGIPGINLSPQTSGLSSMTIAGLFNLGDSLLTPLQLMSTEAILTDKLAWVKGRHTFSFGADYQHEIGSSGYLTYGRGYYTFLNLSTSAATVASGGNAFASFLVGAPYEVLRDTFPPGLTGLISYRTGFFAHDDFKATSRLTLNLGVRYDIMPYPREMHNRLSNFDPATRTMLIAGEDTSVRLMNTDSEDWAPRVGAAYALGSSGKTVLRAGYGIGYVDPLGAAGALNSNQFNVPFYYVGNITQFPYSVPAYTLSSGLPPTVIPSASAPNGNLRYLVPTDRNPYSQSWSFDIQRSLMGSSMLEVGYVGTSGTRLLTASDINAAPPGTTNPVTRQPFGPLISEVRELSDSAHSTYQGLQAKFERRFSRGFYLLVSYTWSKSIDDQSNGTDTASASGQYPQDPLDPGLDRGLSSFDRTHRLVASGVWEIPFGQGRRFGREMPSAINSLLGGWQASGIFTAETGSPFSVLMNCADVNAEGNNCRPNRLSNGALPSDQRSIADWFQTSAFVIPSPQAYGSAGRNILRAPGLADIDLGVSKSFPLGTVETRRLQIRGELFNLLNHTNLGIPVNSIDSPGFGSITSAAPGRIIQVAARLEF